MGARVSMRCSHPTIALLHGSMATWRQSAPLLAALRARLGARLVAVDALGCGASARPRRKGWLNRRGGGSESKLHRELWSAKDLLEDAACVVERVAGAADSKQRQVRGITNPHEFLMYCFQDPCVYVGNPPHCLLTVSYCAMIRRAGSWC